MPTPNKGEKEDAYVERCVGVVLKDGSAKNQEQAVAMCHSMFKQHQKKSESRSWFSIKSDQEINGNPIDPEIMMYDEIGSYGVSAADFDKSLKALGDVKKITMRINSPGGDSFAGIAIHNMLAKHGAEITAHVDGIAASAASLIAMAADKIVMPKNSFMVVHEPHAMTVGPAQAHLDMAADLERVSSAYANCYAERTGQTLENVKVLMAEDRLMSADECKSKGYADEIEEPMMMAATFDFNKLPEKFRDITASIYAADSNEAERLAEKEADRAATIRELGKKADLEEEVIEAAVNSGSSKKEFREALLAKLLETKPEPVTVAEAVKEIQSASETVNASAKPGYGQAEIDETLEICAIAGVSAGFAAKFITDKTPVAKVRQILVDASAKDAESRSITPAVVADGDGESRESRMASWRETQAKLKEELGIKPRKK